MYLVPRGPIQGMGVVSPDSTSLHCAVKPRFPQWQNNGPGEGIFVLEIPILVLRNFGVQHTDIVNIERRRGRNCCVDGLGM